MVAEIDLGNQNDHNQRHAGVLYLMTSKKGANINTNLKNGFQNLSQVNVDFLMSIRRVNKSIKVEPSRASRAEKVATILRQVVAKWSLSALDGPRGLALD